MLLDLMSKVIPILPSLPFWVRCMIAVWVISGICIWVPIFIYWLMLPSNDTTVREQSTAANMNVQRQAIEQSPNSTNIQVGRDLIINPPAASQHAETKYIGVLLSPTAGIYPEIEIGNSGTIFQFAGENGTPLFTFAKKSHLTIEIEQGRMKVTTLIHDRTGAVVAELVKNEWKVAPPPRTWDRNYSEDALEVKDDTGDIVLQVRMIQGRVQMQAVYYDAPNSGTVFVENPGPEKGAVIDFFRPDKPERLKIKPIFRYPSEHHLGKFAQLEH